ncbi:v-SNARE protein involved in Golgi transport [Komagataella phaffii CBS 7435]|uniref:Golgi SNAP receptor complex member 1 n=2 Tax=Komagataella phaffii TaxID=460519 RepID=C4QZU3_KOMPG|nr:v-SNARE protein involved in Golgi transport, homolog of the mammalian protein GOS-28/GS28 [Komagataella phaffii GS115]AOA62139.1 GQ67_00186T0 [Komagataella phaffii]CAH2448735.1 v-SNARE protein involved in Golgi transport [Komagataella phaffii CBS 7435]AOA67233.1 GQ68_01202T0 [Komagataella phaffii GS115]CAY68767.1 v-SNARE protein involved in Golgi transport, homolog of the mammalian protein GOS-28/GS28 [Komagataella phaffii GS115]CCA38826.1 v-SNARE protein involved in Golgi transport [Komaga
MSNYSQTRSQALQLENKTESLLSQYASFGQSSSSSATGEELSLEKALKDILERRQELVNALSRIADSDDTLAASKLQQLHRHKEILNDHKRDFGRIQESIQQERNKLNLLFSVRSDIQEHKKRSHTSNVDSLNEEEYMRQERNRVDNVNSFADRLLSQAYETRDEFSRQRHILNNAASRISESVSQMPGINVIVSKINTRRKRDSLIIAGLITMCIILLWLSL